MPYTKSGIYYTLAADRFGTNKPTGNSGIAKRRQSVGLAARGYAGNNRYKFIAKPTASGSLGTAVRRRAADEPLHFHGAYVNESAILVGTSASTGLEVNPATVLCLNGVGQGDGTSARQGKRIVQKKMHVRGMVSVPAGDAISAAARNDYVIDIFVILDKQTNGGTATGFDSENVFSTVGPYATSGGMLFQRNMKYSDRYKVLKHIRLNLRPQVTFDGTDGMRHEAMQDFSFDLNLKDLVTNYQTGTTTGYVSTIIDNSLHMMAVTNNDVGTPTISYNSRIRFIP